MTFWHPMKYPAATGAKVRHQRHGFGIVIASDRQSTIVRFDKHGTSPKTVDTFALSLVAKPTAESLATVEMTREAQARNAAFIAKAKAAREAATC